MYENWAAIEAIEQAESTTPFCSCGELTSAAARDGNVWLECISLREEPTGGTIVRFLRSIMAPVHVRELIIDNQQAA
jgi:hypothetical protein